MNTTRTDKFEVIAGNEGRTKIVARKVIDVPVVWDEEAKDWILTAAAHELIEDTQAQLEGVYSAKQLREIREYFQLTQSQISQLLQIGEKSWSRWESGRLEPSRCVNLLIRCFSEGKIDIQYLTQALITPPKLPQNCQYRQDGRREKAVLEPSVRESRSWTYSRKEDYEDLPLAA
jgi:DNA-binding transcriptional regulator YiaG